MEILIDYALSFAAAGTTRLDEKEKLVVNLSRAWNLFSFPFVRLAGIQHFETAIATIALEIGMERFFVNDI
ncbi:MAG: hypothetical protein AAF585_10200 [Verrucomicrobiota bacterium]